MCSMTYREKYAERISIFTKEQLEQEEREQKALIALYKERLEICTNEKKVHDAKVGLRRADIRLKEILKYLIKNRKELK